METRCDATRTRLVRVPAPRSTRAVTKSHHRTRDAESQLTRPDDDTEDTVCEKT